MPMSFSAFLIVSVSNSLLPTYEIELIVGQRNGLIVVKKLDLDLRGLAALDHHAERNLGVLARVGGNGHAVEENLIFVVVLER